MALNVFCEVDRAADLNRQWLWTRSLGICGEKTQTDNVRPMDAG